MKLSPWNVFQIFFHLGCLTATIFCTFNCFEKWNRDDSSYEINYQRFHKGITDVYPSVSLCFSMPFPQEKLDEFAKGISAQNYSDFIMGLKDSDKINRDIYDDVIMKKEELIVLSALDKRKLGKFELNETLSYDYITVIGFNVRMHWFLNCYTFNFPLEPNILINGILIKIKKDIFPNNTRPMDGWDTPFGLSMFHHLPNQILRSHSTRKSMWHKVPLSMKGHYSIIAYVSSMEVIARRQRKSRQCSEIENYDQSFLDAIMTSQMCKPPYWNSTQELPNCKTSRQLKKISEEIWATFFGSKIVTPPCTEIKSLQIEYEDTEAWDFVEDDEMFIQVYFRDTSFKQIKEKRDYDIQDMFGDIGGYVGLFLGYALVNIPEFFLTLSKVFKRTNKNIIPFKIEKLES